MNQELNIYRDGLHKFGSLQMVLKGYWKERDILQLCMSST